MRKKAVKATKAPPQEKSAKPRTTPTESSRRPAKRKKPSGKAIKTYAAAMDYLSSLVNHERRLPRRPRRGMLTLDRTKRLLSDLGDPQDKVRTIHIAGSKGKGSTAAMLSQMLANNGLRIGIYSSPHVADIRERIAINSDLISREALVRLIARVATTSAKYGDEAPTYFEALTACAFIHFADEDVDAAVIETGLGGRWDATNVITPEVCAMTSISLDHMPQLGDTLEAIASEKAGVFKKDVPIVSARQDDNVKGVLKKAATEVGASVLFAGDDIRFTYRFEASRTAGPQARICVSTPTSHFDHLLVPLVGEHQAMNCGVAIGVLDQLKNRGFELDDELSISGLANVRLVGRMEMLCSKPRVLGDGAHNAASIDALMRAIGQNVPYDSMVVIFGCCADKDVEGMLRHVQLGADKVIFTKIKSPRGMDPKDLATSFAEVSGRMAQVASSLEEAFEIAGKAVTREDLICVTGSFYLVSEARVLFENHPHRAMSMIVQTA